MTNETKNPTLLDGVEISDPAALEDLTPQELFAAIKDANSIANYPMERASSCRDRSLPKKSGRSSSRSVRTPSIFLPTS